MRNMAYSSHTVLGKISKVYGYEGFVTVRLEKRFIGNYHEQESVFLEIEGRPVPFFVELSDFPGGDEVRLKFEGYEGSSVGEFVGCRVFLTIDELEEDVIGMPDLTGFSVVSSGGLLFGTIKDIIDNTSQYLLVVGRVSGSDILVPLCDEIIKSFNEEAKTIVLDLPDDLTTIND